MPSSLVKVKVRFVFAIHLSINSRFDMDLLWIRNCLSPVWLHSNPILVSFLFHLQHIIRKIVRKIGIDSIILCIYTENEMNKIKSQKKKMSKPKCARLAMLRVLLRSHRDDWKSKARDISICWIMVFAYISVFAIAYMFSCSAYKYDAFAGWAGGRRGLWCWLCYTFLCLCVVYWRRVLCKLFYATFASNQILNIFIIYIMFTITIRRVMGLLLNCVFGRSPNCISTSCTAHMDLNVCHIKHGIEISHFGDVLRSMSSFH